MRTDKYIQFLYAPLESSERKENMYYGASHLIFRKAEELRNRMTSAEEILWKHIHINQWKLKFRRQHPVWNYVVDFIVMA